MAKKSICAVDDEEIGFWPGKMRLSDGSIVCEKHWKQVFPWNPKIAQQLTIETFMDKYNSALDAKKEFDDFQATRQLNGFFLDENKAEIKFNFGKYKNTVLPASEITDVVRDETSTSITKGGAGKAAVGGLLFGTIGAVAGGSNKQYDAVRNLRVIIHTKSHGDIVDSLFTDETKTSGIIYKTANKLADDIVSDFHWLISKYGESEQQPAHAVSVADELLKFKQLLDAGAITQDEFDAQKAKLLK